MSDQWWSWALSLIGAGVFFLAGRKVWWCWYVGIGLQALWAAYALVTEQYGFLVGCFLYTPVYVDNAVKWTREHRLSRIDDASRCPVCGVEVPEHAIENHLVFDCERRPTAQR